MSEHTDMTGAARLREALDRQQEDRRMGEPSTAADDWLEGSEEVGGMSEHLRVALERIVAKGGPYVCGQDAYEMVKIAREALAAVPEAPEPVYEWRAVFPNSDGSYSVQPLAKAPRPGTRMLVEGHNRGWVERRHAVAWERVEGTER